MNKIRAITIQQIKWNNSFCNIIILIMYKKKNIWYIILNTFHLFFVNDIQTLSLLNVKSLFTVVNRCERL